MLVKGKSPIGEYSFNIEDLSITLEVSKISHPDLEKWDERDECSGIESSEVLVDMLKSIFPNLSKFDYNCADMYSTKDKEEGKARMVITFQGLKK